MSLKVLPLLIVMSLVPCGCTGVMQWQRHMAYQMESSKAMKLTMPAELRGRKGRHFANGFEKAYVRFLMTGDCRVPVVAPKEYQTVIYENPQGQKAINDWFDGYRAGLESAQCSERSQFRAVAKRPSHYEFDCNSASGEEACPCGGWSLECSP